MTASTFLTREKGHFKTNSINSGSSMNKFATPTFSRIGSRNNSTPYQQYKVKNKSRRKIFTNQLIPSKNKIIKASRKSSCSDYQCTTSFFHLCMVLFFLLHDFVFLYEFLNRSNFSIHHHNFYIVLPDKTPDEMSSVKVNLKLKADDNFIDMLGAIDPSLKIKTLYNFKRINDIKGNRPIMSQLTSRRAID